MHVLRAVNIIGGQYSHGQRFLANMNMTPPVSTTRSLNYKAQSQSHAVTEKVAMQTESASELRRSHTS